VGRRGSLAAGAEHDVAAHGEIPGPCIRAFKRMRRSRGQPGRAESTYTI
jgi:hypothetical protein